MSLFFFVIYFSLGVNLTRIKNVQQYKTEFFMQRSTVYWMIFCTLVCGAAITIYVYRHKIMTHLRPVETTVPSQRHTVQFEIETKSYDGLSSQSHRLYKVVTGKQPWSSCSAAEVKELKNALRRRLEFHDSKLTSSSHMEEVFFYAPNRKIITVPRHTLVRLLQTS